MQLELQKFIAGVDLSFDTQNTSGLTQVESSHVGELSQLNDLAKQILADTSVVQDGIKALQLLLGSSKSGSIVACTASQLLLILAKLSRLTSPYS